MRLRNCAVVLVALLLGPAAALSCGPSVQSIYEGDVRFEHCYRLDLENDVAPTHRSACWSTWLDRYTYGQSRDRLEYARRRMRAFASGDPDRPELHLGGDAPAKQDARQFYLVVPAPTSLHAPPPPIATRVNIAGDAPSADAQPSAKPPEKTTPGEACATACKSSFTSCNLACDPAAKSPACKSCDPDYKKCMARCFE